MTTIGYNFRDLQNGAEALQTCSSQIRGVVQHIIDEGKPLRAEWGTSQSGAKWDTDQQRLNADVEHFAGDAFKLGAAVAGAAAAMARTDSLLAGGGKP